VLRHTREAGGAATFSRLPRLALTSAHAIVIVPERTLMSQIYSEVHAPRQRSLLRIDSESDALTVVAMGRSTPASSAALRLVKVLDASSTAFKDLKNKVADWVARDIPVSAAQVRSTLP
jgi:hypothetical protein